MGTHEQITAIQDGQYLTLIIHQMARA